MGFDFTGDPDNVLDHGVIGLEIIITDRPVDDVSIFDGAEFAFQPKVFRFESMKKTTH